MYDHICGLFGNLEITAGIKMLGTEKGGCDIVLLNWNKSLAIIIFLGAKVFWHKSWAIYIMAQFQLAENRARL